MSKTNNCRCYRCVPSVVSRRKQIPGNCCCCKSSIKWNSNEFEYFVNCNGWRRTPSRQSAIFRPEKGTATVVPPPCINPGGNESTVWSSCLYPSDLYISGQSGLAHVIPWSSHCCCICLSLIVFSPSSFFPGWRVCCALVPGTLALDCIDHWYWPFHKPLHKPLYQPLTSDSPTSIHSRFLFLHSVWSHYSCCSVTKAFVPGTRYLSRMKNQDAHRVYRWWWRSVERTV